MLCLGILRSAGVLPGQMLRILTRAIGPVDASMEVHSKGDSYNVKMARVRRVRSCAMDDRPGHGYASPQRDSSRTYILELLLCLHSL